MPPRKSNQKPKEKTPVSEEDDEVVIPADVESDEEEDLVQDPPAKRQKTVASTPNSGKKQAPGSAARSAPEAGPAPPRAPTDGKALAPGSLAHLIPQLAKPTNARALKLAVHNVCNLRQDLSTECLAPRLKEPHDVLVSELARALSKSEPSSALIIGPTGSGKTLLANTVVQTLQRQFNGEGKNKQLVVIRLNGNLYVNQDERVAFKSLARQVCDLLSVPFNPSLEHNEDLTFIKDCVERMASKNQTVLFLLDAFENFAPKHARQTLLYTLLNMTHLPRVGACILGVSAANNVVEALEKRVKSRFSHRQVLLSDFERHASAQGFGQEDAEARSHAVEAARLLQTLLTVPRAEAEAVNASQLGGALRPDALESARSKWNESVAKLLGGKQPSKDVLKALEGVLLSVAGVGDVSARTLALVAMEAVDARPLNADKPLLEAAAVVRGIEAVKRRWLDSYDQYLSSLSSMDLLFLTSCFRLTFNRKRENVNLREIFQEYQNEFLSFLPNSPDRYTRESFLVVLERLVAAGLLQYVDANIERRRSVPKEFRAVRLVMDQRSLQRLVRGHPRASEAMKKWLESRALQSAGTDGVVLQLQAGAAGEMAAELM